jgi:hypothetical protein
LPIKNISGNKFPEKGLLTGDITKTCHSRDLYPFYLMLNFIELSKKVLVTIIKVVMPLGLMVCTVIYG